MFPSFGKYAVLLICFALSTVESEAAKITVSWEDSATSETGFRVERALDGITFIHVATVGPNTIGYVDAAVARLTTYYYRIAAIDAEGAREYSEIVKITTDGRSSAQSANDPNPSPSVGGDNRLVNLSVRAVPQEGERALFVGFVVNGGSKAMLVRAIGPGLSGYTTSTVFPDPKLTVYSGTNAIAINDDWGGAEALKSEFARLGAFPLSNGSKDAAVASDFAPGGYTATITGAVSGLAMAEIYDADGLLPPTGRLVNLSARAYAGSGDGVLIVGFVISGNEPMRVLVRAIGPTLSTLGVVSVLSDPQLNVFKGSTLVGQNDNWSGSTELRSAFTQVGAFMIPDSMSRDAAVILTLQPGAYTAIVSGIGGAEGVALAEVYELR